MWNRAPTKWNLNVMRVLQFPPRSSSSSSSPSSPWITTMEKQNSQCSVQCLLRDRPQPLKSLAQITRPRTWAVTPAILTVGCDTLLLFHAFLLFSFSLHKFTNTPERKGIIIIKKKRSKRFSYYQMNPASAERNPDSQGQIIAKNN